MVELGVQVAEHQENCKTLSHENKFLNKRLDEIIKCDSKGKGEESIMQIQLDEELTTAKDVLIA